MNYEYLWRYAETYEQALKSYEEDRLNEVVLNVLISMTCVLNKKDEFEKYTNTWNKLTQNDHWLKTFPFIYPIKPKEYSTFSKKYSESNVLPPGHLFPKDILKACAPAIARIFGTPISVALEIMPNSENKPELIAWIKWFGDIEEGMKRYSLFENWYIENNYDLKTDLVFFNI